MKKLYTIIGIASLMAAPSLRASIAGDYSGDLSAASAQVLAQTTAASGGNTDLGLATSGGATGVDGSTFTVTSELSGVAEPMFTPVKHPVVPEPTTLIAGAMLLLPFGASAMRIMRKKSTA